MDRRQLILGLLMLVACGRAKPAPVFPPALGGWQLKSAQSFPAGTAPETVRKTGTRGWWSADYEGPGAATVELYELTSAEGGLDLVQRWRPAADTVVWYTQRYFVVVRWRGADRAAVGALVRGLQKQFAD
jgi:hypothetical protein